MAKTYDAKAMGIKTGMAVWEAKKVLPHAHYISADFGYYGQVSQQIFAILRRFSPDIEIYSIDEAFVDLNGIRSLWHKNHRDLADMMRLTIAEETGITVSIGVSVTRTLAKIASDINKPNGTTVIPGRRIARYLHEFALSDIPGLGKNRQALLAKFGIQTAAEFVHAPPPLMHRLLGVLGKQLQQELQGIPVWSLQLEPALPKSISRTASIGVNTSDKRIIEAHLYTHAFRLIGEMVSKSLAVKNLRIFLRLKSFDVVSVRIVFPIHTQSLENFNQAVHKAVAHLFDPQQTYRACGLVADGVILAQTRQQDLFGVVLHDQKQGALFKSIQEINHRYGHRVVKTAKVLDKVPVLRFKYPMIQAH